MCRAERGRLRMILLWWIVELLLLLPLLLYVVDGRLVGFERISAGHDERRRGLRNAMCRSC